jgi:hypothetical protein
MSESSEILGKEEEETSVKSGVLTTEETAKRARYKSREKELESRKAIFEQSTTAILEQQQKIYEAEANPNKIDVESDESSEILRECTKSALEQFEQTYGPLDKPVKKGKKKQEEEQEEEEEIQANNEESESEEEEDDDAMQGVLIASSSSSVKPQEEREVPAFLEPFVEDSPFTLDDLEIIYYAVDNYANKPGNARFSKLIEEPDLFHTLLADVSEIVNERLSFVTKTGLMKNSAAITLTEALYSSVRQSEIDREIAAAKEKATRVVVPILKTKSEESTNTFFLTNEFAAAQTPIRLAAEPAAKKLWTDLDDQLVAQQQKVNEQYELFKKTAAPKQWFDTKLESGETRREKSQRIKNEQIQPFNAERNVAVTNMPKLESLVYRPPAPLAITIDDQSTNALPDFLKDKISTTLSGSTSELKDALKKITTKLTGYIDPNINQMVRVHVYREPAAKIMFAHDMLRMKPEQTQPSTRANGGMMLLPEYMGLSTIPLDPLVLSLDHYSTLKNAKFIKENRLVSPYAVLQFMTASRYAQSKLKQWAKEFGDLLAGNTLDLKEDPDIIPPSDKLPFVQYLRWTRQAAFGKISVEDVQAEQRQFYHDRLKYVESVERNEEAVALRIDFRTNFYIDKSPQTDYLTGLMQKQKVAAQIYLRELNDEVQKLQKKNKTMKDMLADVTKIQNENSKQAKEKKKEKKKLLTAKAYKEIWNTVQEDIDIKYSYIRETYFNKLSSTEATKTLNDEELEDWDTDDEMENYPDNGTNVDMSKPFFANINGSVTPSAILDFTHQNSRLLRVFSRLGLSSQQLVFDLPEENPYFSSEQGELDATEHIRNSKYYSPEVYTYARSKDLVQMATRQLFPLNYVFVEMAPKLKQEIYMQNSTMQSIAFLPESYLAINKQKQSIPASINGFFLDTPQTLVGASVNFSAEKRPAEASSSSSKAARSVDFKGPKSKKEEDTEQIVEETEVVSLFKEQVKEIFQIEATKDDSILERYKAPSLLRSEFAVSENHYNDAWRRWHAHISTMDMVPVILPPQTDEQRAAALALNNQAATYLTELQFGTEHMTTHLRAKILSNEHVTNGTIHLATHFSGAVYTYRPIPERCMLANDALDGNRAALDGLLHGSKAAGKEHAGRFDFEKVVMEELNAVGSIIGLPGALTEDNTIVFFEHLSLSLGAAIHSLCEDNQVLAQLSLEEESINNPIFSRKVFTHQSGLKKKRAGELDVSNVEDTAVLEKSVDEKIAATAKLVKAERKVSVYSTRFKNAFKKSSKLGLWLGKIDSYPQNLETQVEIAQPTKVVRAKRVELNAASQKAVTQEAPTRVSERARAAKTLADYNEESEEEDEEYNPGGSSEEEEEAYEEEEEEEEGSAYEEDSDEEKKPSTAQKEEAAQKIFDKLVRQYNKLQRMLETRKSFDEFGKASNNNRELVYKQYDNVYVPVDFIDPKEFTSITLADVIEHTMLTNIYWIPDREQYHPLKIAEGDVPLEPLAPMLKSLHGLINESMGYLYGQTIFTLQVTPALLHELPHSLVNLSTTTKNVVIIRLCTDVWKWLQLRLARSLCGEEAYRAIAGARLLFLHITGKDNEFLEALMMQARPLVQSKFYAGMYSKFVELELNRIKTIADKEDGYWQDLREHVAIPVLADMYASLMAAVPGQLLLKGLFGKPPKNRQMTETELMLQTKLEKIYKQNGKPFDGLAYTQQELDSHNNKARFLLRADFPNSRKKFDPSRDYNFDEAEVLNSVICENKIYAPNPRMDFDYVFWMKLRQVTNSQLAEELDAYFAKIGVLNKRSNKKTLGIDFKTVNFNRKTKKNEFVGRAITKEQLDKFSQTMRQFYGNDFTDLFAGLQQKVLGVNFDYLTSFNEELNEVMPEGVGFVQSAPPTLGMTGEIASDTSTFYPLTVVALLRTAIPEQNALFNTSSTKTDGISANLEKALIKDFKESKNVIDFTRSAAYRATMPSNLMSHLDDQLLQAGLNRGIKTLAYNLYGTRLPDTTPTFLPTLMPGIINHTKQFGLDAIFNSVTPAEKSIMEEVHEGRVDDFRREHKLMTDAHVHDTSIDLLNRAASYPALEEDASSEAHLIKENCEVLSKKSNDMLTSLFSALRARLRLEFDNADVDHTASFESFVENSSKNLSKDLELLKNTISARLRERSDEEKISIDRITSLVSASDELLDDTDSTTRAMKQELKRGNLLGLLLNEVKTLGSKSKEAVLYRFAEEKTAESKPIFHSQTYYTKTMDQPVYALLASMRLAKDKYYELMVHAESIRLIVASIYKEFKVPITQLPRQIISLRDYCLLFGSLLLHSDSLSQTVIEETTKYFVVVPEVAFMHSLNYEFVDGASIVLIPSASVGFPESDTSKFTEYRNELYRLRVAMLQEDTEAIQQSKEALKKAKDLKDKANALDPTIVHMLSKAAENMKEERGTNDINDKKLFNIAFMKLKKTALETAPEPTALVEARLHKESLLLEPTDEPLDAVVYQNWVFPQAYTLDLDVKPTILYPLAGIDEPFEEELLAYPLPFWRVRDFATDARSLMWLSPAEYASRFSLTKRLVEAKAANTITPYKATTFAYQPALAAATIGAALCVVSNLVNENSGPAALLTMLNGWNDFVRRKRSYPLVKEDGRSPSEKQQAHSFVAFSMELLTGSMKLFSPDSWPSLTYTTNTTEDVYLHVPLAAQQNFAINCFGHSKPHELTTSLFSLEPNAIAQATISTITSVLFSNIIKPVRDFFLEKKPLFLPNIGVVNPSSKPSRAYKQLWTQAQSIYYPNMRAEHAMHNQIIKNQAQSVYANNTNAISVFDCGATADDMNFIIREQYNITEKIRFNTRNDFVRAEQLFCWALSQSQANIRYMVGVLQTHFSSNKPISDPKTNTLYRRLMDVGKSLVDTEGPAVRTSHVMGACAMRRLAVVCELVDESLSKASRLPDEENLARREAVFSKVADYREVLHDKEPAEVIQALRDSMLQKKEQWPDFLQKMGLQDNVDGIDAWLETTKESIALGHAYAGSKQHYRVSDFMDDEAVPVLASFTRFNNQPLDKNQTVFSLVNLSCLEANMLFGFINNRLKSIVRDNNFDRIAINMLYVHSTIMQVIEAFVAHADSQTSDQSRHLFGHLVPEHIKGLADSLLDQLSQGSALTAYLQTYQFTNIQTYPTLETVSILGYVHQLHVNYYAQVLTPFLKSTEKKKPNLFKNVAVWVPAGLPCTFIDVAPARPNPLWEDLAVLPGEIPYHLIGNQTITQVPGKKIKYKFKSSGRVLSINFPVITSVVRPEYTVSAQSVQDWFAVYAHAAKEFDPQYAARKVPQ